MNRLLLKNTSPAFKLAAIYLLFSAMWILSSDELVTRLYRSEEDIERLQNLKGLTFVILSGGLLYVISRRLYLQLQVGLKEKTGALNKLTALIEASKEGIIDYDYKTKKASLNEEMQRFLGADSLSVTDFDNLHKQRLHPHDRKRMADQFSDFANRDERLWQAEYRYRNAKGQYREMLSRGYLIRDEATNEPSNLVIALQDVTEIRQVNAKFHLQKMQHRQELARHILEAQDIERNRWAEELHDNVCQLLTVAKLYLDIAAKDNNSTIYQEKAQAMVQKSIDDIRQISALIKPPEFSTTTLTESIGMLFSNLERFHNTHYDLVLVPELEEVLTEAHKVLLYRVLQEGLNNIVKYADATEVTVVVKLQDRLVDMRLKDNGKGFLPHEVKTGIGLQNIRSRLQAFAGQLTIHSSPGNGCELKAQFYL